MQENHHRWLCCTPSPFPFLDMAVETEAASQEVAQIPIVVEFSYVAAATPCPPLADWCTRQNTIPSWRERAAWNKLDVGLAG